MIIGIILAGGPGKRLNCIQSNKTVIKFGSKPLIQYGVDLFKPTTDKIVVVVGALAESVTQILQNQDIIFAKQDSPRGTGDAVRVAVNKISQLKLRPKIVLVGYGDHMMFYPQQVTKDLIKLHQNQQAAVSIISTKHHDPNSLAWGRLIRNQHGLVEKIIEQKDATPAQTKIKELNAGLYCFDWQFLKTNINKIKRSPITHEYYLPEMIKIAKQQGLAVAAHLIRFRYVGIGINTREQLEKSQKIYRQFHQP